MKFLGMVLRNARRNKVRSFLTIASLAVSLFLSTMLVSFLSIRGEIARSVRGKGRMILMNAQGFTQPVPVAQMNEVAAMPGVGQVTPFLWFGANYKGATANFGQFAVDPSNFLDIYDELTLPPDQLKAWQGDMLGCILGRKVAADLGLQVGDPLPLKDGPWPVNVDLTVRGIYDGPETADLRTVYFPWSYVDESLRKTNPNLAGNAGIVIFRCRDEGQIPALCRKIDESNRNSANPSRTQSEEAFNQMFFDMVGDLGTIILAIGMAVGISLLCVAANAMAMALRERTTEIAVLKAIGFGRPVLVGTILAEAVLIAGLGGLIGAFGAKLVFDAYDLSGALAGMFPLFYIPWTTALAGVGVALAIGLLSGLVPAIRASQISVIDGLRKVV